MMPYDYVEKTNFEDRTFQEVVESFLYTSDSMFGDIQHDAQIELSRRLQKLFPPPDWAKKHWFPNPPCPECGKPMYADEHEQCFICDCGSLMKFIPFPKEKA